MFFWGGGKAPNRMAGFGRACDVNTRPSQAVKHPQILQIFSVGFFFFFLGGGLISQRLFNSAFCNARASLKRLLMRSRKTLTTQWYSDDRARMISLSQISESTFIIQCDKLTRKMSVKFYTYMNFCVRSPSVHLFFSESIAEGFFVPGSSALCFQAFKQIALRPSEFAD